MVHIVEGEFVKWEVLRLMELRLSCYINRTQDNKDFIKMHASSEQEYSDRFLRD
jgi:hypothetical protein